MTVGRISVQLMVAAELTDSPVHLIGTSMGGGIAGLYASRYPDHLALLTLICPTGKLVNQRVRWQKTSVAVVS